MNTGDSDFFFFYKNKTQMFSSF